MKTDKNSLGPLLIILAGIFWGSMGLFVRALSAYGFSPIQIVSLRLSVAALVFSGILLIKEPSGFHIRLRDLPVFLGLGLVSVLFFTVCYFTAIEMMPLSTAAILLYTSPIWVMLMSALFFREKLTRLKLLALALAFGGCVLVSGFTGGGISGFGLLTGLCSGLGYGLYSIFGSVALRRHSPFAVTAWTFIIASIGSWFLCSPADMIAKAAAAPALSLLPLLTAAGLVTAVIPFLCYTLGLRSVEPGRAAILATVEPMVATVFGCLVYKEPLRFQSALGIAMILSAVVLLNLRKKAA